MAIMATMDICLLWPFWPHGHSGHSDIDDAMPLILVSNFFSYDSSSILDNVSRSVGSNEF